MSGAVEVKKSVCVWCKGECGVLVYVRDNHLVKLEEDPGWPRKIYPPLKGCPRLRAAKEWFYHPDRVNFPLKRAGGKGEGRWQRITWDQALDEIAQKLKQTKENYGAEAIANTTGTGYRTQYEYVWRFFNLLGSPNCPGQSTICFGPRSVVADAIIGMFPHYSVKPATKCIVLLGVEPLVSRPLTGRLVLDARKNGAKLIVIDPRHTRSASQADVWLQLRPGTDSALLLGMINVIIQEELFDRDFVEKWCYGFDQLRKRAAEYPLPVVEEITGVPAQKIAQAARIYASNRPGCFIEGMGIEHLHTNAQALHARWILAALTGNIDVEGGEELAGPHPQIISDREVELSEHLSPEQRRKQLGADRFKLLSWPGEELISASVKQVWGKAGGIAGAHAMAHGPTVYRAMLTGKPYPIKALISIASNPMVTQANTKLVYKALKSLDLYVVMDFWMTPGAELADYVLPAACWLERPMLHQFGGYANAMISGEASLPYAIPGEYDHRIDYDFCRELGLRLGQKEYWPWRTLEEAYDDRLKPIGYTHREFVDKVRCELRQPKYKKYEAVGFGTATGKVELHSTVLEKLGYDPLPRYEEPPETRVSQPELAKEYPLTLITGGRIQEYYHSEWRQIDSVRRRHPHPLLQIHPAKARELGIEEGNWVWIETKRGRVKAKAKLFEGVAEDVVHAEHGWWLPELPGEEPWLHGVWEVNINVVMDDEPEVCNQQIGSWPLRTALCKVYKVKIY